MTATKLSLAERAAGSWPLTYSLVLAGQAPSVIARIFLTTLLATIALWITGHSTGPAVAIGLVFGLGPLVWSLLAMVIPDRGWLVRQRMGARPASAREQEQIDWVLSDLAARDPRLPRPCTIWVIDDPSVSAFAVGESIVVSRRTIEEHLESALAHELGHLAHRDGRHTHALNRTLFPRLGRLNEPATTRSAVLSGMLGFRLSRPIWGSHFRAREYAADQYAASLGLADELADYFERVLPYEQPVPLRWLTDYSHPPIEHRIERLRHLARQYDHDQGEQHDQTAQHPAEQRPGQARTPSA